MSDVVERTELLAPEPAIALADLLDLPLPDLEGGEGLPLTWHWVYLLDRPRQQDLGEDGHPVRNAVPAPPGAGTPPHVGGRRCADAGAPARRRGGHETHRWCWRPPRRRAAAVASPS